MYARRYAGFRRGAAAIVGDDDAAHDVVQDAFAHALARRNAFRGGSAEAWVWRSVARRALDRRRSLRRTTELGAEVDERLLPATEDPELVDAMLALTPRRRLVVFLRYFADLSYAEIARVCAVSEGTVAATLAQAHAELRGALEREEVER